jgi:CheY-like chemotaxis protein
MPSLTPFVQALVVEHDPVMLDLIGRWAASAFVTAHSSRDETEALTIAARHPISAAIIADCTGGQLDSQGLAERLRALRPALPLVFLADSAERLHLAHRAFLPRATTVRRPFQIADLSSALERVLHEATAAHEIGPTTRRGNDPPAR